MTTFFVRPVNGSDAADGLTFATAKRTFAAAVALVSAAGDIIRCCVEGTETLSGTPVSCTGFGTVENPVVVEAADDVDGSPLTDGTLYDLYQPGQTQDVIQTSTGGAWRFRYFQVRGGNQGIDLGSGTNSVYFEYGRVTACNVGVYGAAGGAAFDAFNTDIDNCTTWGARQSTSSRFQFRGVGCRIFNNGAGGLWSGQSIIAISCLFYGNGGNAIEADSACNLTLIQCTIHDNDGDGVYWENDDSGRVVNCSITSNGGYGINFGSANYSQSVNHCLINGNTSGGMNGELSDYHNVNGQTSAPMYADAGSADFKPASGSPLIGNGAIGGMIGAIAHDEGGGGGGVLVGAGSGRFGVMEG